MRANHRKDTKPELRLRTALHKSGLRYRVDRALRLGDVRVRPDIMFGPTRIAVFVDGCFWHGCAEHGELPSSNREFWEEKFRRNIARDRLQDRALESAGWTVIRVWEHEDVTTAARRITARVRAAQQTLRRQSVPES